MDVTSSSLEEKREGVRENEPARQNFQQFNALPGSMSVEEDRNLDEATPDNGSDVAYCASTTVHIVAEATQTSKNVTFVAHKPVDKVVVKEFIVKDKLAQNMQQCSISPEKLDGIYTSKFANSSSGKDNMVEEASHEHVVTTETDRSDRSSETGMSAQTTVQKLSKNVFPANIHSSFTEECEKQILRSEVLAPSGLNEALNLVDEIFKLQLTNRHGISGTGSQADPDVKDSENRSGIARSAMNGTTQKEARQGDEVCSCN